MSDDQDKPGPSGSHRATSRLSSLSALHGVVADPLPRLEIPSEPPAAPPMVDFGTEPPPDDHALLRGEDFGVWAEPEAPTRSIDTMVGKVVDDRYEIKRMIGRGGMGAVFESFQPSVQRTVALKVLLREFAENETVIKRFHKEALAASRLTHPNTISVYDFGQTEDGILFIAMEYLRGVDLAAVLDRERFVDTGRALYIMRQVCKSLSEAHKAGIIHRDLKPDNIFLTEIQGESDFVKVLDFGVAKIREGDGGERTLTQAGTMFGTPKYMSPEQTRSTKLDPRSDIYSLGVILYEMLMGEPPFVSDNPLSILIAHVNEEPACFADRCPDREFHPAVEAVVFQALQKDRDDRQADVDVLLAQIEALIELEGGVPYADLADRLPDPALFGLGTGAAAPTLMEMPAIGDVVLDDAPAVDRRPERRTPIGPIVLGVVVLAVGAFVAFGTGPAETPADPVREPVKPPVREPVVAAPPTPVEKPVETSRFFVTSAPPGALILRAADEVVVGKTSSASGEAVVVDIEIEASTTYVARLAGHFDQEFTLDPAAAVDDESRRKHLELTRKEPEKPTVRKTPRSKPVAARRDPEVKVVAAPPAKPPPVAAPPKPAPGPIELPDDDDDLIELQ